jgi:hypothetical protein
LRIRSHRAIIEGDASVTAFARPRRLANHGWNSYKVVNMAIHGIAILFLTFCLARPGAAQEISLGSGTSDTLAHIVPRLDITEASDFLVTGDGRVALVRGDGSLVLQFTSEGLAALLPTGGEGTAAVGVSDRLLFAAVRVGVRALMDHGVAYPLASIADISYSGGRLHIRRTDETWYLNEATLDGEPILASFLPEEAAAFSERFRTMRAGSR